MPFVTDGNGTKVTTAFVWAQGKVSEIAAPSSERALLRERVSLPWTLPFLMTGPLTSTEFQGSLKILQHWAWTPLCGRILPSSSSYWRLPHRLGHPGPSVHVPRIFRCSHLLSAPHPPRTRSHAEVKDNLCRECEPSFPNHWNLPSHMQHPSFVPLTAPTLPPQPSHPPPPCIRVHN